MAHEFVNCKECGEIEHIDNGFYINGENYCERCFFEKFRKCDECDEYHEIEYVEMTYCDDEEKEFCEDCFSDHVQVCLSCSNELVAELEDQVESLINKVERLQYCIQEEYNKKEDTIDTIRQELKQELADKIWEL